MKKSILTAMGAVAFAFTLTAFACAPVSRVPVKRILLIDAETNKPIQLAQVTVTKKVKIYCSKAPCKTRNRIWKGETDPSGVFLVPSHMVKSSSVIQANGYVAKTAGAQLSKSRKVSYTLKLVQKDQYTLK
jgi:hypothetical protein